MVIKLKIPTIPITEIEQSAFCQTDDELASKSLEEEFSKEGKTMEVSDEDAEKMATVGDAVNYIVEHGIAEDEA